MISPSLPGPPLGAARPRRARRPWAVLVGLPSPPGRPARSSRDHHDRPDGRAGPPPGAPPPGPPTASRPRSGSTTAPRRWPQLGRRLDPRRRPPPPQPGHRRDVDRLGGPGGHGGPRRGPRRRSGRAGQRPAGHRSDLARDPGAEQVDVRVDGGSFTDLSMEAMRWIDPVGPGDRRRGRSPPGPASSAAAPGRPGAGGATTPAARTSRPTPTACASRWCTTPSTPTTTRRSQTAGILAGIYQFHTGPRLVRHRLQLPRRPVRPHLAGPLRRPRRTDHRRPLEGLQHRQRGRLVPGAVRAGRARRRPPARPAPRCSLLYELLAWKFSIHGVNPPGERHRRERREHEVRRGRLGDDPDDHRAREREPRPRPGANLAGHLPEARAAVAFLKAVSATPERWAPFANPRENAPQYPRMGSRAQATNTEAAWWASRMQRDGVTLATHDQPARVPEANQRTWSVPASTSPTSCAGPTTAGSATGGTGCAEARPASAASPPPFATSSEFTSPLRQPERRGFVRRVYRNVLGREPDQSGAGLLDDQLESGTRTRGQVMTGFSESSEFGHDTRPRSPRSSSTRPCSAGPERDGLRRSTYRLQLKAEGTVATYLRLQILNPPSTPAASAPRSGSGRRARLEASSISASSSARVRSRSARSAAISRRAVWSSGFTASAADVRSRATIGGGPAGRLLGPGRGSGASSSDPAPVATIARELRRRATERASIAGWLTSVHALGHQAADRGGARSAMRSPGWQPSRRGAARGGRRAPSPQGPDRAARAPGGGPADVEVARPGPGPAGAAPPAPRRRPPRQPARPDPRPVPHQHLVTGTDGGRRRRPP